MVKIRPEKIQACTGIEAMTSAIPVQRSATELTSQLGAGHYVGSGLIRVHEFNCLTGLIFFYRRYFHYCLSSVHYCEDHFHIHVFICSSNISLSYVLSRLKMFYFDITK